MRTMYDAVNVANIPAGASMVAGYMNGEWPTYNACKERFPHAIVVGISVTSSYNAGTVLDVEKGDATAAEAPFWVQMRRAAGIDPTVYCSISTIPSVEAAFKAAGVTPPHIWAAGYSNPIDKSIPAGCIARQYTDTGKYDISSVADYWPGVDPKPTTPPVQEGTDMTPEQEAKLDKVLASVESGGEANWAYRNHTQKDPTDVHGAVMTTYTKIGQIIADVAAIKRKLGI